MIGNVTVGFERFRHGDSDLAARLHLFAVLGKENIENGDPCAVVRLIDRCNGSPALFAVRRMMYAAQRGAAFKRAVRGNAAFGSQFVYSPVFFAAASAQRKAQRQRKRENKEN